MQEIFSAITALGHLANVTKLFVQERDEAKKTSLQIELSGAIIDLQAKLTTLQMSHQALADENAALKKQIAGYDRWEKERSRYELVQPNVGVFAYRLKASHQAGEPGHFLCPNCFKDNKKSILQRWNEDAHKCPSCQTFFGIVMLL